jgi:hypothetical protein
MSDQQKQQTGLFRFGFVSAVKRAGSDLNSETSQKTRKLAGRGSSRAGQEGSKSSTAAQPPKDTPPVQSQEAATDKDDPSTSKVGAVITFASSSCGSLLLNAMSPPLQTLLTCCGCSWWLQGVKYNKDELFADAKDRAKQWKVIQGKVYKVGVSSSFKCSNASLVVSSSTATSQGS